ncbi:murein L,D-transpeptidase catalytic domain family protein [Adhaeribacter sp. BT258]|uniref:Murein L,D-transpeptidase catalytic domain family protein n=1 Tax=Adhaeribacter terrigena TaxID=2793070 RepID=A0ABS1BYT2_9BACT|nr:murein L,D-transpeptidase catalytic domain family protein [Adhaeribacter terrigena]MBK0401435.1 murein L,D-transpeptidase catalytic domain family protein [Adhaeribacter terrigena]
MGNVTTKRKLVAGKRFATRILPFFAPLFFATLTAPSKTVEARSNVASHFNLDAEVKLNALKKSNFQMNLLEIYEQAGLEKKGMTFEVFDRAMIGYLNLKNAGLLSDKQLLSVVDFDLPSTKKRFWLIDLEKRKVLENTFVSHGKNSGGNMATQFSNTDDSNMSSLGFYVTGETYYGRHGLSLKLDGMDAAHNSNARLRDIVMHGAEYVSKDFINQQGRLGRSEGCPALPMGLHQEVIEQVQDRTVLFIHASVQPLQSRFLNQETAMEAFYKNDNLI